MNSTEQESTGTTQEDPAAAVVTKAKARIGKNLTEIETLFGDLHMQALATSNDHDFPGGAALNMLAPVADIDAWQRRYEMAEHSAASAPKPLPFDSHYGGRDYAGDQVDHEIHPVLVLDKWAQILRAARNQPTDLEPTLWRASDYIRASLDWMFIETDGEPNFRGAAQLMRDLSNTRSAMENVLKAGSRPERTRVTCTSTECEKRPRLVKTFGSTAKWDCYKCPSCGTNYTPAQWKLAQSDNLWHADTERFVRVSDAIAAIETPPQTVWSWMRRGKVTVACDRISHTLMVWWPDVRQLAADKRQRDIERQARLAKKAMAK